jgi:hypothetical protein
VDSLTEAYAENSAINRRPILAAHIGSARFLPWNHNAGECRPIVPFGGFLPEDPRLAVVYSTQDLCTNVHTHLNSGRRSRLLKISYQSFLSNE